MRSKTTKLSLIVILVLFFSNLAILEVKGEQDYVTKLGSLLISTNNPNASPVQNNDYVSNSYYLETTGYTDLYNLGYGQGQLLSSITGNQDEVVILDFGDPSYQNGQYGTRLIENGQFKSISDIANAVEAYAHGFFDANNESDNIRF